MEHWGRTVLAMDCVLAGAEKHRGRPLNSVVMRESFLFSGGCVTKPHFARMAQYNAWANARVYAAARSLPDESYRKNVGAFFGSLHGTLNHLLVTDRIWMRRLTGEGDHPVTLNAIMFDDLASLERTRTAEDDRIVRYVDALGEEEIGKEVNYSTTKGVPQRDPLGAILAHLFNHQTHHRGQAHAILTVLGIPEPQPLDLLVMLREKARQHSSERA